MMQIPSASIAQELGPIGMMPSAGPKHRPGLVVGDALRPYSEWVVEEHVSYDGLVTVVAMLVETDIALSLSGPLGQPSLAMISGDRFQELGSFPRIEDAVAHMIEEALQISADHLLTV